MSYTDDYGNPIVLYDDTRDNTAYPVASDDTRDNTGYPVASSEDTRDNTGYPVASEEDTRDNTGYPVAGGAGSSDSAPSWLKGLLGGSSGKMPSIASLLGGAGSNPLQGVMGLMLLSKLLDSKSRTPTVGGYKGPGINMDLTATRQAYQPQQRAYGAPAMGQQFF